MTKASALKKLIKPPFDIQNYDLCDHSMRKAMLEMEVPESCFDCNLRRTKITGVYKSPERCVANNMSIQDFRTDRRHPGCPLKIIEEA